MITDEDLAFPSFLLDPRLTYAVMALALVVGIIGWRYGEPGGGIRKLAAVLAGGALASLAQQFLLPVIFPIGG
jgi:hypothetical protein